MTAPIRQKALLALPAVDAPSDPSPTLAPQPAAVPNAPADVAAQRNFAARTENPDAAKAGTHSLASLQAKFEKVASSYLALAGINTPPSVDAHVDDVVARARANKSARCSTNFTGEHGVAMAKAVLGLNTGDDQIVEARVKYEPPFVRLEAYDKKGFHVLSGTVTNDMWHPTDLHISGLKASHGRNCDDFDYAAGEAKMPGRGNALAIAVGLEAIIDQALASGASRLSTLPGSDQVAALYAKMGFTSGKLTGNRGGRPMTLDLTNKRTVRKALIIFALSRSHVKDVPKNVTERMVASGKPAPEPQPVEKRPAGTILR